MTDTAQLIAAIASLWLTLSGLAGGVIRYLLRRITSLEEQNEALLRSSAQLLETYQQRDQEDLKAWRTNMQNQEKRS